MLVIVPRRNTAEIETGQGVASAVLLVSLRGLWSLTWRIGPEFPNTKIRGVAQWLCGMRPWNIGVKGCPTKALPFDVNVDKADFLVSCERDCQDTARYDLMPLY